MENILTIDLEEWYHSEYVKNNTSTNNQGRVAKSLDKTLQLLREHGVNATFFVVGELAEKHPGIIEKIDEDGHEIAFHGYYHESLSESNPEKLQKEIKNFDSLLKNRCIGYRAPSFSLNNKTKWALKVLEDAGFQYDSSVFPTITPLYGVWGAPTRPYKPSYEDVAKEDEYTKLWEFPLLVHRLTAFRIPMAGGFYLRFFPARLVKRAIRKANRQGFPAVIFLHSWELDPEIPRLKLGPSKSFVTYYNLKGVRKKLEKILSDFTFTTFRDYLEEKIT